MTALRIERSDIAGRFTVDDALARFYDDLVRSVAATSGVGERRVREWIDEALISDHGFRSQTMSGPEPGGAAVLRGLQDGHLLRAESRRGAVWFELAHDRLIEPIRASNEQWRSEHLSALQIKAEEWDTSDRPDGLLIGGHVLEEMTRWAAAHPDQLLQADQAYLDACHDREQRAAQLQRSSRRNKILLGVATCLLVVAIAGLVFALNAQNEAEAAKDSAESEAKRAVAAEAETADALVEAQEQRRIADDQRQRAEDEAARAEDEAARAEDEAARAVAAEAEAADALKEAEDQRQLAQDEAARAVAAEAEAADALKEAEDQRQLAQDEAARAVSAEAATARALADVEEQQRRAEQQRRIAEANAGDAVDAVKAVSRALREAMRDGDTTAIFGGAITTTLAGSGCDALAGERSSFDDLTIAWDLNLVNDTGGPVRIVWIAPSGNRMTWDMIPVDGDYRLIGIRNWVWFFEDANGDCLGAQRG